MCTANNILNYTDFTTSLAVLTILLIKHEIVSLFSLTPIFEFSGSSFLVNTQRWVVSLLFILEQIHAHTLSGICQGSLDFCKEVKHYFYK